MKIKNVIALTAALTMLGISTVSLTASAETTYIVNETFEDGLGSFIGGNDDFVSAEGGVLHLSRSTSDGIWVVAGSNMTLTPGKTYVIEFDAKADAANMYFTPRFELSNYGDYKAECSVDNKYISTDSYTHITGTITAPDSDDYDEYTSILWFHTDHINGTYSPENKCDYYLDNVKVYELIEDDSAVAKVGEQEYDTLDAAINNANGEQITLLKNAELNAERSNATANIDGQGHTITVNVQNTEKYQSIFSNLTLSNATLTGSTNSNIAINATMTGVTVSNLSYDCLALNVLTAEGCTFYHNGGVYSYAGNPGTNSLNIKDTTISNLSMSWTDISVRVENVNGTIENSKITGAAEEQYDVSISSGASLTVKGNSEIGKMNKIEGASLTFASDFSGSVNIYGVSANNGTVIATAETGADCSKVTVNGMNTETQELKVVGNDLVIAEKISQPTVTEAKVVDEGYEIFTGDTDENDKATLLRFTVYGGKTVSSDGTSQAISVDRVKVIIDNGEAVTKELGITISDMGGAKFAAILDGKHSVSVSAIN